MDETPPSNLTKNPIVTILRDRRLLKGAGFWVFLVLLTANLEIYRVLHRRDLSHGKIASLSPIPLPLQKPIRYDESSGEFLEKFWKAIPDARQTPLVLLIGMSQLFTIYDRHPGDQTVSEWLDDLLSPQGVRAFGLVAPNLSNEEALLVTLASLNEPATKPSAIIFGACLDKFRNIGLRPSYQAFLRGSPKLLERWRSLAAAFSPSYPKATSKMLSTLGDFAAPFSGETTRDQSLEATVRTAFSRWFPLIAIRKHWNAEMQQNVFELRRRILQLKSTDKRPLVRARYEMNQEFLNLMIDVAQSQRAKPILYISPLNPQSDNPYVPEEYEQFKQWVAALARTKHVIFGNLEGVVPAELWGLQRGEPDFKHFGGEGHRILAARLSETLEPLLLKLRTRRR